MLGAAVICLPLNSLYVVFLFEPKKQHNSQLEKICDYLYPRQFRKCYLLGKVENRIFNISIKKSQAWSWRTSHILLKAVYIYGYIPQCNFIWMKWFVFGQHNRQPVCKQSLNILQPIIFCCPRQPPALCGYTDLLLFSHVVRYEPIYHSLQERLDSAL